MCSRCEVTRVGREDRGTFASIQLHAPNITIAAVHVSDERVYLGLTLNRFEGHASRVQRSV